MISSIDAEKSFDKFNVLSCTLMFTNGVFTIAKLLKTAKVPTTSECTKKI
jgi:hypothetical protein